MSKRQGRYAILAGDFHRSLKTAAIGNDAAGVYAKCLSYSADQMSDGLVPADVVRGFCRGRRVKAIIRELTTPIAKRDGEIPTPFLTKNGLNFVIHNYGKRNLLSDQWEQIKKSDRERKQRDKDKSRGGKPPDSGSNSGPGPVGVSDTKTPRHQDSLKRERNARARDEKNQEDEKPWYGTDQPAHIRVTGLWVSVGQEVCNDPHIYADHGTEKQHAEKLWNIGRKLDKDFPLDPLYEIFKSYWTEKHKAGTRPRMVFMLQDINNHIPGRKTGGGNGGPGSQASAVARLGLEDKLRDARNDVKYYTEQNDKSGAEKAAELVRTLAAKLRKVS